LTHSQTLNTHPILTIAFLHLQILAIMQTIRIHNLDVPNSVLQEYQSIQKLTTQSNFNYDHFSRLMEICGQIIYGTNFKLYREDKDVLLQLYAYFTGDNNLCKHYEIDLCKGLFLSGKTGVETSLTICYRKSILI